MKCENICSIHKNPVNCILHLIAGIILIYALWMHSIKGILIAVLIALIGHIIQGVLDRKQIKPIKKK
jgi:hypothetical protein